MFASRNRIRIGEIGGHEIAIDPLTIGLVALILFSQNPAEWAAAVLVAAFLSILVHELGHAFAIRRLTGQRTIVIVGGLGGVTLSAGTRDAWRQVRISLAGPFAGFLLGGLGWAAAAVAAPYHDGWPPWAFTTGGSIWLVCLHWVIYVSLFWGLVNLLPIWPLDGGQALRAFLVSRGTDLLRAGRITRRISLVLLAAAGIWALREKAIFLIFLIAWMAMENFDEGRRQGF